MRMHSLVLQSFVTGLVLFWASIPSAWGDDPPPAMEVDVDGDGNSSIGDQLALEQLSELNAGVVTEALDNAEVRSDGTVDLSPYLLQFNDEPQQDPEPNP